MTSGKAARRQRQQVARPPVKSTEGRKASPLIIVSAAGIVLLGAVVVGIALASRGSSSSNAKAGPATKLPGAGVVASQLGGIPQSGNVLGTATAPATLL